MRSLALIDNTPNQRGCFNDCEDELVYLSSQTIGDMKDAKGKKLLLFPYSFQKCEDDIGSQRLFTVNTLFKDKKVVVDSISTGNLMGFIGINNKEIVISSRFSTGINDDFFLQYMLQRVMSVNVMKLKYGMTHDGMFELLAFMFPEFLRRAVRQGLFRQYVRKKYNDANVKGTIDINRHIRRNIPFNGCVAYSTREFDADTPLMQLVRHTIEHLSGKRELKHILIEDCDIKDIVKTVISLTPSYNTRCREQVIKANLKPFVHPYFTEYASLQKLCLQILRHHRIRFGESEEKIYGILFDGAWLWEEYLAKLLQPLDFIHPRNKRGEGRIYLCKNSFFPRYPDFYKESENNIVIDAKYKRHIDTRDDINQILTYMYRLKGRYCAFILPQAKSEQIEKSQYEFLGYGGRLGIHRLIIPSQTETGDYGTFVEEMKKAEENLVSDLDQRYRWTTTSALPTTK